MKTTFYKNLKAFTLCAGFFSLVAVACKEKSTIKPDLIPGVDNIHTFEVSNFNIVVNNSYRDSLWTNDYTYQVVTIGRISSDPFFGKTTAGVYLQFIPPANNFAFPAGFQIDSSVLSIPYGKFAYADTNWTNTANALHLKAYRITDAFALGDATRRFYSFDKLGVASDPIGSGTVTLKSLRDTTVLSSGDTITNLLRLKLNSSVNSLFQSLDPTFMASATTFMDFFKGIYLTPDTTIQQNTLASFILSASSTSTATYSNAQIECYYHTAADPTPKVAFFRFSPVVSSFFNSITRNYNGAPVSSYLNNQTANSDSLILQGYPGFRSDLTIKIDPVAIPPSVINKAELKLTVLKSGADDRFSAPPQLLVRSLNTDGTERTLSDILNGDDSTNNASGPAFVGGLATSVTIGTVQYLQYTINFPREFQKVMSEGKSEVKLRILIPTANQGAYRMIGAGPNSANTDARLRLNVIYTKLN